MMSHGSHLTAVSLVIIFLGSILLFPARIVSLVPTYQVESSVTEVHPSDRSNDELVAIETLRPALATTSLVIVGDVMLGRHVEYLMGKFGSDYPYRGFNFISSPQYVLANFEASVPVLHKKTPNFGYVFSVASSALPVLRSAGVTHVSLANNHTTDHGIDDFYNTERSLSEAGIVPLGVPTGLASTSVSVITIGTLRVGVMALHTLAMTPDEALIETYLSYLNKESDLQVAYLHWGSEYEQLPSTAERLLARKLSQHGVDLVIGHHPHVVQSVERINDTLVFYSLGNFIFDQYFSAAVQEGLALKLSVEEGEAIRLSLHPYESKTIVAQPRPMVGTERQDFLETLADISGEDVQDEILRGEFFLPLTLASSTKTAMMSQ